MDTDQIGRYHIPLTAEGCAQMLETGVPCEIPTVFLLQVLQYIYYRAEQKTRIMIETRNGRAYLTPDQLGQTAMKWIDVNDYLPPIGVEVLCFRPQTDDYSLAMSNKPIVMCARRSDGLFPGLYPVTHWLDMDMPPGWTDEHAKKQHT